MSFPLHGCMHARNGRIWVMILPYPPATEHQSGPVSADRLCIALINMVENSGLAAVSGRQVSDAAGVKMSSIYHHFGGMEQLYASSFEWAWRESERWCRDRLDACAGLTSAECLAPILADTIDDWCEGQRHLAFAWRECHLLAERDPSYRLAADRWELSWQHFWDTLCAQMGLVQFSRITRYFFDGESFLHLLRWRRPVDRAALDEMCRNWAARLLRKEIPPSPCFDWARDEAGATSLPARREDPIYSQIAEAAAILLKKTGAAGMTHRAVAAEAGLTLGTVSHRVKTKAELLQAAFERVYQNSSTLFTPLTSEATEGERRVQAMEGAVELMVMDRAALDMDELILATARDPALQPFAGRLRYCRGRTSRRFLQLALGGEKASAVDAALISAFKMGFSRRRLNRQSPETSASLADADLRVLIDLMSDE
ncbi:TetR/AcrR family transcriptional regulator [Sphingobium tyrosinilyticum]|uniref:TetR/AcrR family transcriptional regulator n=1 Tax=Sphingobium tyrosinilyticum TaxID=2715436 RepID=A0ABV9F232_9SPHN